MIAASMPQKPGADGVIRLAFAPECCWGCHHHWRGRVKIDGGIFEMTRIELCTDYLSRETREAILDALYEELHIPPGQVTADGAFELDVVSCKGFDAIDSPVLRVDGVLFMRVTPKRAVDIIRARRRGR
jgi:hypothetical protein